MPTGKNSWMQMYTVFQKKNWTLCYFIISLCFDSYKLHENFQKYIGVVACCEYGIIPETTE